MGVPSFKLGMIYPLFGSVAQEHWGGGQAASNAASTDFWFLVSFL